MARNTRARRKQRSASEGEEKMVKVTVPHTRTVRGKTYHRGEQEVPESVAESLGLTGDIELPKSDPRFNPAQPTGGPTLKDTKASSKKSEE
jgi:hypothetical protein